MIKTRSLTSLFLSAMLTSSLIPSASKPVLASPVDAAFGRAALESAIEGMRAEGFHASAPREWAPAPAPSRTQAVFATDALVAEPPLTEEEFLRLKKATGVNPVITYNEKISALLGLTQGGERLPTRQLAFSVNGVRHAFAVSANNDKDVLIIFRTVDTITVILTDSTRTIRSAVIYIQGKEPRLAAVSEVEAIFTAELKVWAAEAATTTGAGN